jgi:hypothetical protein
MGMLGMVERPTETRFFIIFFCMFFAHVNRVLAEEGMRSLTSSAWLVCVRKRERGGGGEQIAPVTAQSEIWSNVEQSNLKYEKNTQKDKHRNTKIRVTWIFGIFCILEAKWDSRQSTYSEVCWRKLTYAGQVGVCDRRGASAAALHDDPVASAAAAQRQPRALPEPPWASCWCALVAVAVTLVKLVKLVKLATLGRSSSRPTRYQSRLEHKLRVRPYCRSSNASKASKARKASKNYGAPCEVVCNKKKKAVNAVYQRVKEHMREIHLTLRLVKLVKTTARHVR